MTVEPITKQCKLLTFSDGMYKTYIFEDVNKPFDDELKFIYCVRPPNWHSSDDPSVGDVGYLQIKYTKEGDTEWYNKESKSMVKHNYTSCYFVNFIKDQTKDVQRQFKM